MAPASDRAVGTRSIAANEGPLTIQIGTILAQFERDQGLTVDAARQRLLADYLDLLARWNQTYNLTAVRDRASMLTQHLSDCLALVPALRRHLENHTVRSLLDVGSGGGLPGVVIAVMQPEMQVTCVDAVAKKVAFIRQVGTALSLPNLHALHARVENLPGAGAGFDVITSRAFATLRSFVDLTRPLLAYGGVWVAMKGAQPADELEQLSPAVDVFHVERLQVPELPAQRCLVWMRNPSTG